MHYLLVQSEVGYFLDGAEIDFPGHRSEVKDFQWNSCLVLFTWRRKVFILLPDYVARVRIPQNHPVTRRIREMQGRVRFEQPKKDAFPPEPLTFGILLIS